MEKRDIPFRKPNFLQFPVFILPQTFGKVNRILKRIFRFFDIVKIFSFSHKITFPNFSNLTKVAFLS